MKTWNWAVFTQQGIYQGTIDGELEETETEEQALESVTKVINEWVNAFFGTIGDSKIVATFVSPGTMHIDAPGATLHQLDIITKFSFKGEDGK